VAYPIHYEVFQSQIQETKKENNPVVEMSKLDILVARQAQNFMFLKAKSMIEENSKVLMQIVTNSVPKYSVCLKVVWNI